jgi:2',3'-cyclic-nucleotide 2'-phosphodiesterase (5'-nucleotidase family)
VVVRPVRAIAAQAVSRLRAAGADFVVALVHAGLDGPSSYDTTGVGAENEGVVLAGLADRPDLVILGHTHARLRDSVVNGVHFVQPQSWARSVSVVHAWLAPAGGTRARLGVVRVQADEIPLADVPPDPVLTGQLRDTHEEVRYWAGGPLAVTEGDWSSREARVRDTPFLDFLNEVQRRHTGADLSAASAFSTTAGLGPGPVRLRDVAGVYPYEHTLRVVRIAGDRLREYLEHSSRYFSAYEPGRGIINDAVPGYDYDVVAGVAYEIDLTRPVGERIRGLSYEGRAVTAADTFTLAISSYRQSGGGGYDMLRGLRVVYDRGESVRVLVENALRDGGTLRAADYYRLSWRIVPEEARAAALGAFVSSPTARDTVLFRVVATGALHGALEPGSVQGRPLGGLAAVASRADSLTRGCPCPTFRLDAGGAFHGSLLADLAAGRVPRAAFAVMRLDAVAPSGGDLAALGDSLTARVAGSPFVWTAANLRPPAAVPGIVPWVLLEREGRSLAVIGVAPRGSASGPDSMLVSDPAAAVAAVLPTVRAADPDAIIVIGDFDAACDSGCEGEAVALVEALDSGAVHAVIGGAVATTVRGTPVVPVLAYGVGLSAVDVIRRPAGSIAIRARTDTVWGDQVTPDSAVRALVSQGAEDVRRIVERPVATLRFALPGDQPGESALGRLAADAVRSVARREIAVIPGDAFRGGLDGGTVRVADLLRLLPQPSPLVVVTLTGEALTAGLERAVAGEAPVVHISGITVRYDPRRPPGKRVREVRLDDGRRVDRKRTYTLALPAELLAPERGFSQWAVTPRETVGTSDRDALLRYLGLLRQPVEAPETIRFDTGR